MFTFVSSEAVLSPRLSPSSEQLPDSVMRFTRVFGLGLAGGNGGRVARTWLP